MKRIHCVCIIVVLSSLTLQARDLYSDSSASRPSVVGGGNANSSLHEKSADCSPATGLEYMRLNNVSALIETGGLLWQDRSRTVSAYEVPIGSEDFYLFAGGIWCGGYDPAGQLKLAAQKFGVARDYWAGPLTVTPGTGNLAIGRLDYGAAEIDPEVCAEYDQFYSITRAEVAEFRAYYACENDPDCDATEDFPNYTIPSSILNWPAHGDVGKNQDFYLAPFYDADQDGIYNPQNGDYPWYDLDRTNDCRTNRQVTLFGDFTLWWVFNDKGNVHGESGGDPIGMEIRSQAFGFTTNDEINNMTFYNYQMINRATQRLTETYFSVYADADIGFADNDYVGCDVARGVGYAYNGTAVDAGGNNAIGANPGAIGIDFFEGPYQDNDGLDNPLTTDIQLALAEDGIPYEGLGIGYGDEVIDNERLGMKRFVYYVRQDLAQNWGQDPTSLVPIEFYNYMAGRWRDNTPFTYGGDGHAGAVETKYCFPGDSDPYFWSTGGVPVTPAEWTDASAGNQPSDRRFLQVAGPFTLEPGALNNITVGVVYGRGEDGNPFTSVREMLKADDKAQALFNNCFRIIDGPDAPDLTIQELDKGLILYITNPKGTSNNYREVPEDYEEVDPNIQSTVVNSTTTYELDTLTGQYVQVVSLDTVSQDQFFRFEGYQVYQLKSEEVGPEDLQDPTQARLVAQCDIKNGVSQLINYIDDSDLGVAVPVEQVNGENEGIRHSFSITEDEFASGNTRLINHKKYYFMAIAYGHNNYKTYSATSTDGQQKPYLAGRKSAIGAIKSVTGIPHIPAPELGGTDQIAAYGDGPEITRIEGKGNGGGELEFTAATEAEIVANFTPQQVTYQSGAGPIAVKVIDPLNVTRGIYQLKFIPDITTNNTIDEATWELTRTYEGETTTITSEKSIRVENEQLIPEWGISVNVAQYMHEPMVDGQTTRYNTEFISSSLTFTDPSKMWLSGVQDVDGSFAQNWIRSGNVDEPGTGTNCNDNSIFNDVLLWDDQETFENEVAWAPFKLCAVADCYDAPTSRLGNVEFIPNRLNLSDISSVDVVFTSDRSKWSRCVVLETQDNPQLSWDGSTIKMQVKRLPSKDKYGNAATPGSGSSNNEEAANFISDIGMSWFPGYVIDLETGERLNLAFGEDSWLGNEGGKDMLFNPSDRLYDNFGGVLFGGKHYVYIFKNGNLTGPSADFGDFVPAYDHGAHIKSELIDDGTSAAYDKLFESCMWVGMPMLSQTATGLSDASDPYSYIETEARVKLRVTKEYGRHSSNSVHWNDPASFNLSQNNWYPLYEFDLENLATNLANDSVADSALAYINVVPNPYYAYSNYEFDRLDNLVKIVNLPDECNIRIYSVSGTLVRTFSKDSPITSIDWDLKNYAGIPIASGMYIIHVDVPGVGERVVKWFGVVRPVDLENF